MSDPNLSSQSNGKTEPSEARSSTEKTGASLLDLILVVVRNRRLVTTTIITCAFLGLLLAVFSTSQYTSSAKVIREVESENAMGSLGGLALLRGMGVNLGGSTTGLTPEAYPDIINSREVRLAVVRDTFYFRDTKKTGTLAQHMTRPTFKTYLRRFTIGLPGTIVRAFSAAPDQSSLPLEAGAPYPTPIEEQAMKAVSHLVSTEIDQETGLMLISTTTNDPYFSADLANSFVRHLVERIEVIRTEKAKRDLQFITSRFYVAQDSLKAAENALSVFDDRNINPQSARLKTQRARLLRQVTFKTELFSDLQAQLTQAEIDFQRSRPVITLLENPVPPVEASGPKRLLLIIISIILGTILGICLAFIKGVIERLDDETEGAKKFNEIANAFSPLPAMHRLKSRFTSKAKE